MCKYFTYLIKIIHDGLAPYKIMYSTIRNYMLTMKITYLFVNKVMKIQKYIF